MDKYYKVPAKREYQNKPMKCNKCGEETTDYRLFSESRTQVAECVECPAEEQELKSTREREIEEERREEIEPEKEVVAIRPDIPPGVSYVGKMIDENTYVIKTNMPIRALERQEVRQADEAERRETKGTKRLAEINTIDSLKNSFSRGVR